MLHRKKPGEIFSVSAATLQRKGVLAAVTKVIPLPRDLVGARKIMLRALQATAVVFQDNAILFQAA